MSEMERDAVMNYRPGPQSELPVEMDEPVLAVFASDRRRYWTDHAAMAGIGAAAVLLILPLFGKAGQIPIAVPAVIVAIFLRGAYLASEQFARRWQLTDRRLIGPQGRNVMLLELLTARKLLGDVQIVTKSGQKHLLKHLADSDAVVTTILQARDARAMVAK
ncbi:hypothetical protein [Phaeovulum sp.]|uniref:hypothetical protein n=1 Tax=Phaeovulum sp. TaxID=2934796 RepID=UPI0039E50A3F